MADPIPTTSFAWRKFGASVSSNTFTQTQRGEIAVPRSLIFRRVYFAFLTWQLTDPSFWANIHFKLGGRTVSQWSFRHDGDKNLESTWWYSGPLPGVEASTMPFLPPFEVHARPPGASNMHPADIGVSGDSVLAHVTLNDQVVTPTINYPFQVVMHPYRMVGEFDSIEWEGNVLGTGFTGGGLLYQVWLGCASDARRA